MAKLYYQPAVSYICGICGQTMAPDTRFNIRELKDDEVYAVKFFCTNIICKQYQKDILIQPLEVSI
jgi:hypothetical protein